MILSRIRLLYSFYQELRVDEFENRFGHAMLSRFKSKGGSERPKQKETNGGCLGATRKIETQNEPKRCPNATTAPTRTMAALLSTS